MTKTESAIALIKGQGMTVRQAARAVDVSESAVHAALKKQRLRQEGICSCCGQKLPEKTNG